MKVLHQLIKHFWCRGALAKEQADYLVEHGFIRATELDHYEPLVAGPDETSGFADQPFPIIDPLEEKEERLSASLPTKRKGRSPAPRLDFSAENLGKNLRKLLQERVATLPALARLTATPLDGASIETVAAMGRRMLRQPFRLRVLRELGSAPGLLAKWWDCLDPEPFHLLLSKPEVRGPVTRAFDAILTAASPGEWGRAAWLLKVPEVQTVANLISVRRQLVSSIRWLYEKHQSTLDRSMRRPARPARSWQALGVGLVLVYNARAWRARQKPSGYVLRRLPNAGAWPEAWTTAISLDAERVIPYCVHIFGNVPTRGVVASGNIAITDVELICPNAWKI